MALGALSEPQGMCLKAFGCQDLECRLADLQIDAAAATTRSSVLQYGATTQQVGSCHRIP